MERGDIDNHAAARIIYVFEGTIGTLSPAAERKRNLYLKTRRWKKAAHCWTIEPFLQKVLLDHAWRSPYNVDLATYLDLEEAEHVEQRLESLALPFGHFLVTDIEEMARVISNRPDVAAIYDFHPSRVFTYGSKGRSVVGL